jgi:hypothetical protein
MTGFIRGLFKKKSETVEGQEVKPRNKSGEYFLDQDAAKTYGDIDYMRTARSVKKSFPRIGGSQGEIVEVEEVLSSLEKLNPDQKKSDPIASEVKKPEPASDRRRSDPNLDMFRKMAKDINK